MTKIQVGDVELQRFPAEGYAPIEDCYQQCENAGLVVAPGNYLAQLRIAYPESNSPAWKKVRGFTGSIVVTGNNQIVVAHANHPLMTAKAIRDFKSDSNRFVNYGIVLTDEEFRSIVAPYKNNNEERRDVWYIDSDVLAQADFVSDVVPATVDATKRTLLVPYIGSKNPSDKAKYIKGHTNNLGSRIGVFFDSNALKESKFLVRPLWFGDGYINSLVGGGCSDGCVFGVSSSAVGTAQKKALEDLL